jgi:hypothetical protein
MKRGESCKWEHLPVSSNPTQRPVQFLLPKLTRRVLCDQKKWELQMRAHNILSLPISQQPLALASCGRKVRQDGEERIAEMVAWVDQFASKAYRQPSLPNRPPQGQYKPPRLCCSGPGEHPWRFMFGPTHAEISQMALQPLHLSLATRGWASPTRVPPSLLCTSPQPQSPDSASPACPALSRRGRAASIWTLRLS